jgi:hypothetical protein
LGPKQNGHGNGQKAGGACLLVQILPFPRQEMPNATCLQGAIGKRNRHSLCPYCREPKSGAQPQGPNPHVRSGAATAMASADHGANRDFTMRRAQLPRHNTMIARGKHGFSRGFYGTA